MLWLFSARAAEPVRDGAGAAATAAPSHDELARFRAEVDRMRAELMRAERRIADLEVEAPAPTAAPAAATESDEAKDAVAALPEHSEHSDEQQRAHVAQAFETEAEDPSWNPESEIQAIVQAALPVDGSVRSVQCRRSLCRVETSHADQSSQQAYANTLGMPRPGPPRPFKGVLFDPGEPSGNGRELRSVTYLVRRGHSFPSQ